MRSYISTAQKQSPLFPGRIITLRNYLSQRSVRDRGVIRYLPNISMEDRKGIAQLLVVWQLIDKGKEARLEQRYILALQQPGVERRNDPRWSSYLEITRN